MRKKTQKLISIFMAIIMVIAMIPANVVFAESTGGKTYYVASTGTDDAEGSKSAPFATIAKGVAALQPSDTLIIKEGSYNEPMVLNGKGTSGGAPITIKGEGKVEITGEKQNVADWGKEYSAVLDITDSNNIDLSNITFSYNPTENRDHGSTTIMVRSNGINLHNNVFNANENVRACVQPNGKCTIILDSNTIGGSCASGIWMPWGFKNSTITNNVVTNSKGFDISCLSGNPDWQSEISDNKVANNTFTGSIASSSDARDFFKGNIVANNIFGSVDASVKEYVKTSNTISNNCFKNGTTLSSTDFTADPKFVDEANGDYHLMDDSQCVGTGNAEYLPENDFDGAQRIGADVGAFAGKNTTFDSFEVFKKNPQGSDVLVNTQIFIAFTDDVATPVEELNSYISVKNTKGKTVSGRFTVLKNVVKFIPAANFDFKTEYTVTIKSAMSGVEKGSLAADVTWNFTTQKDPNEGVQYFIAANGDDSNPGTIEKPKKTVNSLISALKPGDEVIYRAGTYNEVVILESKGSSSKKPITFKSYQGEKVTLTSNNSVYVIFIGHCQNVRVEGLTFADKNGEGRGSAVDIVNYDPNLQQTADITVTGCKFLNCSPGIIVRDVITYGADKKFGNIEISNNIIMPRNPDEGITKGLALQECRVQDGSYAKIYNNVITHSKWSLHMWGRSENVLFYNNTMLDTYDAAGGSGKYDIYPVQGVYNKQAYPNPDISYNCVFKNNIFTKPIRTQLEANATLLDKNKGNVFDNNVYDSSSLKNYVTYNYGGEGPKLTFEELQKYQQLNHEANGQYKPVEFIDRVSDARLSGSQNSSISAATDTINDTVSAPVTDINGRTRTKEAGAYSFDATLCFVGANTGEVTGSFSKPYPTISAAIQANKTNLQVKNGTYNEEGLSIPAGVSVLPYSENGNVTINGNIAVNGSTQDATTVKNLMFKGKVTVSGQNVTLNGCSFASELKAENASEVTVTNSEFTSASETGIVFENTVNSKIFNNIIKNRTTGVLLTGTSTGNFIYNNTFIGNSVNDINVTLGADNNAVRNNIFTSKNVDSAAGSAFDHNCYNTSTLPEDYLTSIPSEDNVKENPAFINERNSDYRLYKFSPCVKKGIMDEVTPKKDKNDFARANPCDIGAYAVTDIKNVYYVAPNGSDSNSGTQASPFKTINEAIKTVRQGEFVSIAPGTYNENVVIDNKTASSEDSYVFEKNGKEAVVINGTVTIKNSTGITMRGIDVTASSDKTAVTVINSTKIRIDNMNALGSTALSAEQNSDITSSQFNTQNVQKGILLDGSTLNLTRAKIKGAAVEAIEAKNASKLTLTSSVILNCAKGIIATDESAIAIVNNTFYNNSGLSVDVTQADGSETQLDLYNNIYARPERGKGAFVSIHKATGFNSEHNIYDAADSDIIAAINGENRNFAKVQEGGDDTASKIADPLFKNVSIDNFAPAKGSPAARGGNKVENSPLTDFNGTSFAEQMDIGAYYSPYTLKTIHVAGNQCAWSDGDGSWDKPYQTLRQAMGDMRSSDTIIVHKGVYYEGRHDPSGIHGVDDGRCTIKGCKDPDCYWCKTFEERNNTKLERPVFTGKSEYQNEKQTASADLFAKFIDCTYLTIEGIDIAGFTEAGIWLYEGCDNIELKDLRIWNIDQPAQSNSGVEGVLMSDITNSTFKDLLIWNIGQTRKSHADHGMYVITTKNCTFENIVVSNSPGAGIQFYCGDNYSIHSRDITVRNCVFSECSYGLIMCGVENFNVVNNTFHNSYCDDLYLDWTVTGNTFQNNLFYNDFTTATPNAEPTVIARHNGTSGTNKVENNLFTHNMYQYKNFAPTCQEGWGTKYPIADYMATQNAGKINTFTEFKAGNAAFVTGVIDKALSAKDQAAQVKNGLFRILTTSDCVNAGLAQNAPTTDFIGTARTGNPDIGAYEAVDLRELVLSKNSISENNKKGDKVADIQVLGQQVSASDSYQLVSGDGSDDNSSFTISKNALCAAKTFNFEEKNSYKVRIKATTSGGTFEKAFIISVDNVEEVPAIDQYVNFVNTPIAIDGVTNEKAWENQLKDLTVAGDSNSPEFKAKMGLLADKNNLYISANVTDSELSNTIPSADWSADMIEAYIDGINDENGAYDDSTVQMQFRYNDKTLHVYGNGKKFENVKFEIKPCKGGYQFEAAIPWSDIGITFDLSKRIGFTANVNDYDQTTDKYGSLAMINGADFWKDASKWQTFGFKDPTKPTGPDKPTNPEKPTLPTVVTNPKTGIQADLSKATLPSSVTSASLNAAIVPATGNSVALHNTVQKLLKADKQLRNFSKISICDLSLLDQNGKSIAPVSGTMSVKIPVPSGMNGNLHVIWYDEKTGKITDMGGAVENGYITFETSHFSYYAVVQLANAPRKNQVDTVVLDTITYTMPSGNIYDIGVSGKVPSNMRVYSSRDHIASVTRLANGNYRVTGLREGVTYIVFEIGGKHASVKVTVKNSQTGLVTLDTRCYTMSPSNKYVIGVTGKVPSNMRVYSSRDHIASVTRLANGNYCVTGLRDGVTFIVFEIGGKHASVKVTVQKGVKQHGDSVRVKFAY